MSDYFAKTAQFTDCLISNKMAKSMRIIGREVADMNEGKSAGVQVTSPRKTTRHKLASVADEEPQPHATSGKIKLPAAEVVQQDKDNHNLVKVSYTRRCSLLG